MDGCNETRVPIRIGVTGHQHLRSSADTVWVKREIEALLGNITEPFVGITSLAIGVDQLFAKAVLDHNGALEVIIPYPEYEDSFKEKDRALYRGFCRRAAKLRILASKESIEQSYLEAGITIVDSADLMIAVWNGKPAAGLGGTADIVTYAKQKLKRLIHLHPDRHTVTYHMGM